MTTSEFNESVKIYADGVYRFIVKNIGEAEEARDIVQTAFEKLWIHRDTVSPEKAKSYLFTVAYHQMIDFIRKANKTSFTEQYDTQQGPATYQKDTELKQVLFSAINELSPLQKSLVLLKDYEGYSYQEIGEIMELSESQVKVYLHRARLVLKNKLVHFQKSVA